MNYFLSIEEVATPKMYRNYRELVKDGDVISTLAQQLSQVILLFSSISEEQSNYRYAPDKWTIKEVLGHMIDTERVMAYRAFSISRGETQPLPGFDENAYTAAGNFNRRSLSELLREYTLLREANLALFRSFDEEMLSRVGRANGKNIAVKDILYAIAGHELHHMQIIRERYLEITYDNRSRR
jgi:hypothetical protein